MLGSIVPDTAECVEALTAHRKERVVRSNLTTSEVFGTGPTITLLPFPQHTIVEIGKQRRVLGVDSGLAFHRREMDTRKAPQNSP